MGIIVTFYSYKGGVGRTMALANVAVLLADWGKKVLVVDWDLEAPGVEHFFCEDSDELKRVQSRPGLIDLLCSTAKEEANDVGKKCSKLLTSVKTKNGFTLQLLTAGLRSNCYYKQVRELDIKSFYENKDGGYIIENLRNYWKEQFDYILVDSRTGITDIGGVCTIQLPDILALVFTATNQSLYCAVEVAEKASVERQKLPFDRSQVTVLPIPSRFDTQTEHEIAKNWLGKFQSALDPLYKPWLPKGVDRRRFLEVTKIPYTPYFSFGEKLPVVEQGTTDPTGLGFAYETIAALLANKLQQPDLILDNRDELLRQARASNQLIPILDRPLIERVLLYVGLVGSRLNIVRTELIEQFQKTIADVTGEYRGAMAIITEDGMVLAFEKSDEALACAFAIQERLAISTPIVSSVGPLRVRMGIHASGNDNLPETTEGLVTIVMGLANKASEGQVVVSETVRNQIQQDETLKLELRKDQFEFISDDAIFEEQIFNAERVLNILLNSDERRALFEQAEETKHRGGFQAFLVGLQKRIPPGANNLELTINDRERIARYAHDYKGGGWQGRLRKIFGRTLGKNLGRLVS